MLRRCEVCGIPYEAKRSTSRFCSATCRQRANRESAPQTMMEAGRNMDLNEIHAVVLNAYDVAQDLSRAAQATEAPLSHALTRVANVMITALKAEGL